MKKGQFPSCILTVVLVYAPLAQATANDLDPPLLYKEANAQEIFSTIFQYYEIRTRTDGNGVGVGLIAE